MDEKLAHELIASNLTVAAMLQKLANALNKKSTTADGDDDAVRIYNRILDRTRRPL